MYPGLWTVVVVSPGEREGGGGVVDIGRSLGWGIFGMGIG